MKIERFDETEFKVIQCGNGGGYYMDGTDEADRAVLLMKEGVFIKNPKNNWQATGWKFTKRGKRYFEAFMKAVQKQHGHVWKTHRDRDPDIYEEDEYGNSIDRFAFEEGYHNGMECKKCGYSFCVHCTPEISIPKCQA